MKVGVVITLLTFFILPVAVWAQEEDLLSLIDEEETTEYATASFKSTRVVNGHSIENLAKGVMDFRISHRFGFINTGIYELFGLDNASTRLGVDYGITDRLMVGIGRSSFEKMYDGYIKYKLLRQSSGAVEMPLTISYMGAIEITTLRFDNDDRQDDFSSRLYYVNQLLIGRKFSEGFSAQVMPTHLHRNLVETGSEKNDVFSLGVAARQKLSRRFAITGEYYYVFPGQISDDLYNSFSIGIDLETGGHVFQLHFTNSTSMVHKGFIAETNGNWFDGDIHFGFNISRVFTLKKPKIDP
jgi:hypothetical protein